ncbi:hypothetical protein LA080_005066 [Diaporthe eres]|nr:hypothetical protein LA080_005066 [Diaporthe eres]
MPGTEDYHQKATSVQPSKAPGPTDWISTEVTLDSESLVDLRNQELERGLIDIAPSPPSSQGGSPHSDSGIPPAPTDEPHTTEEPTGEKLGAEHLVHKVVPTEEKFSSQF